MARKQFLNFDTKPFGRRCAGTPAMAHGIRNAATPGLAVALACVALAGCSSAPKQAYPETFSDTSTYSHAYPASDDAACEAARRALLSQGYTIGKAQPDGVEGQKNFQVEEDKHQVISFHVVCASDHQASPHTTVFVNAVQDRYIIKKTSSSAGVGLSVLGSVSMPFGSSDDSLSKISSRTISDSSFYKGFFDLLQRYLPDSKRTGMQTRTPPEAKPRAAPPSPPSATPSPSPAPSSAAPASAPPAPSSTSTSPASSSPASSSPASPSPASPSPALTSPASSPASSPSSSPPSSLQSPAVPSDPAAGAAAP